MRWVVLGWITAPTLVMFVLCWSEAKGMANHPIRTSYSLAVSFLGQTVVAGYINNFHFLSSKQLLFAYLSWKEPHTDYNIKQRQVSNHTHNIHTVYYHN